MVGRDDTEEGSRGGDQEGFHGEGEVADGGVAFGGGHHTCKSADETDYAADGAALEDLSDEIQVSNCSIGLIFRGGDHVEES